jgi:hypothetical protein
MNVAVCGIEEALKSPSLLFTVIQSTGARTDLRDNYNCTPRRCELKSERRMCHEEPCLPK